MGRIFIGVLVMATGVGCGVLDAAKNESAGGTFTINVASPVGSNATPGTFEAKTITGSYATGQNANLTDAGWSVITGTPNVLDTTTCKSVALGFAGKPAAGEVITLVDYNPDATDGGPVNLNGKGFLIYDEGCVTAGPLKEWRSSGGTIQINAVDDPNPQPSGATPGANKKVTFSYSGVTMEAQGDGGLATGTFTADGTGTVDLFAGMAL
ncbi:MAG: hypothetical protein JST54_25375 [Deltaproteobacteria bacterium]|nr:hypothetical protein [Deltaproteobacteria bacterium]